MGRLRDALRHLRREMRGSLESFELENGGRYYHDPMETFKAVFPHWCACLKAGNPPNWPEPLEVHRKLTEAKDPEAALFTFTGGKYDFLVYDPDALVSERRLEPRSLVAGRDVDDQEVGDLSE